MQYHIYIAVEVTLMSIQWLRSTPIHRLYVECELCLHMHSGASRVSGIRQ